MGSPLSMDLWLGRLDDPGLTFFRADWVHRRLPLAFQFIFIFILYATVPWLPESPRWLIAHGDVDQAEQIIADLENKSIDDPWVITESKEIQYAVSCNTWFPHLLF